MTQDKETQTLAEIAVKIDKFKTELIQYIRKNTQNKDIKIDLKVVYTLHKNGKTDIKSVSIAKKWKE